VSVQGALKVETYERDGETKLSLSLVADRVLALRQPPQPRKRTSPSERLAGTERTFDDAIPY